MPEVLTGKTINSKHFDLGDGRKRLVLSHGVMHYLQADNTWADIDEDENEADNGSFSAVFTKCVHLSRIGDDGARRIYPNRNDLSYYIDIGKPFRNMGRPLKLGGKWLWDFAHAMLTLEVQGGQVKFTATLKDESAPLSMSIPFSSTGISRRGAILYHAGVPIAELMRPVAIDANGNRKTLTSNFSPGKITVTLDPSGMVYPIKIDPTLNLQIGANNDECFRRLTSSYFVVGNATYQAAGRWSAGDQQHGGGMRWTLNIPNGATIDSAALTLRAERTFARDGTRISNTRFSAEDTDDAAVYSTSGDFDTRWANRTTARVDWDGIPGQTVNADFTSPDFASVIQEVIDRPGWSSGNVMNLFWDDFDDRSQGNGSGSTMALTTGLDRSASTTYCPKLDIVYTAYTGPGDATPGKYSMAATSYSPALLFRKPATWDFFTWG